MAPLQVLIRNDDYSWTREFFDEDGNRLDLAGWKIWYDAKLAAGADPSDALSLVSHYIEIDGAGMTAVSRGFTIGGTVAANVLWDDPADIDGDGNVTYFTADKGVLTQEFLEADKDALGTVTNIMWEISTQSPAGKFKTLVSGEYLIQKDITERETMP